MNKVDKCWKRGKLAGLARPQRSTTFLSSSLPRIFYRNETICIVVEHAIRDFQIFFDFFLSNLPSAKAFLLIEFADPNSDEIDSVYPFKVTIGPSSPVVHGPLLFREVKSGKGTLIVHCH